jgi:hypothetical protein
VHNGNTSTQQQKGTNMKTQTATRAFILVVYAGILAVLAGSAFLAFTVYSAVVPLASAVADVAAALAAAK